VHKETQDNNQPAPKVRLDKWLWAARFFKTRSQSLEAISGGHVKCGGDRVKAGTTMHVGMVLEVMRAGIPWEIVVRALSDKRGKGADAALLYEETEAGRTRRERTQEERRSLALMAPDLKGRPTKRDRRAMVRLRTSHHG
jgi:ribosome-associated heat shock protein Hsp15